MSIPELSFRIARISVPNFRYSTYGVQSAEERQLNFKIGNGIRFNVPEHIILFWLGVTAETEEKETAFHIDMEMAFKIENINSLVTEGYFRLPREWALTFAGISVSTLRGILHERLAGTPLQTLILPVINPEELIASPYPEGIQLDEPQNIQ